MIIPDGQEWEAADPPFADFADFLTAQSILNHQGWKVPALRELIGALAVTDQITVADLLFGDSSDESFTFRLLPGVYGLHLIRGLANRVNVEPFFLFLTGDEPVVKWRRVPHSYGADANHMGFAPAGRLAELRAVLEADTEADGTVWNAVCDLVCAYRERYAAELATLGFSFGSPTGEAAPFLIAPLWGCKLATLYLGINDQEEICALQARIW